MHDIQCPLCNITLSGHHPFKVYGKHTACLHIEEVTRISLFVPQVSPKGRCLHWNSTVTTYSFSHYYILWKTIESRLFTTKCL